MFGISRGVVYSPMFLVCSLGEYACYFLEPLASIIMLTQKYLKQTLAGLLKEQSLGSKNCHNFSINTDVKNAYLFC